ncbi:hypothetical protein ABZP36_021936 [Zizania latifolia]
MAREALRIAKAAEEATRAVKESEGATEKVMWETFEAVKRAEHKAGADLAVLDPKIVALGYPMTAMEVNTLVLREVVEEAAFALARDLELFLAEDV